MKNPQETTINIDSNYKLNEDQVTLLKKRYYLNLASIDRLSRSYYELGLINKIIINLSLTAGVVASILILNIALAALFSLSLVFLASLKAHYQLLQERLDVMVKDLSLSEKQLNTAVASNLELKTKLEESLESNLKVVQHLVDARMEVEAITEQAKIKDLKIEEAKQQVEASSQQIATLTSDLLGQKKVFTEKMASFLLFLDQKRLSIGQGNKESCLSVTPAHST
jgi:hypothetical protein